MALRRLAAVAWLLAASVGTTQGTAQAQPGSSFDRSLEMLERNQVITPEERRAVRGGSIGRRTDAPALQEACRSGALSKQDCASGVTFRGGSGRRLPARLSWRDRSRGMPATLRRGPDGQPLPLIRVPVSALLGTSNFRLESVFAVTPRPAGVPGNSNRRLLFPILGSATTTSDFGWRLHPVLGSWLMHAGRDLAAPEGTPVLAALSGTVRSSGLAGGYGIAIELDHASPPRRTLYGHLSELYVKPGQTVRQGDVIGRVGSTGLSTGPHLHFELRRPRGSGWVAVPPGSMDLTPLMATDGDGVAYLMGRLLETLRRPAAHPAE